MSDALPTRSRLVAASLQAAEIDGQIVVLPDAASTAALAAAALGVDVGAIANSLVFWSDDEPLLVMTSGAHPSTRRLWPSGSDAAASIVPPPIRC